MAKTWPPRPAEDFRITSLKSQIDIETVHRRAGFPPVEREVVLRRFWQYLSFLQQRNLLVRVVATSLEHVTPATELRNSDFTDLGYLFVQRFGDRWIGRMYKDRGAVAEQAFLEKWYREVLAVRGDA